MLDQLMNIVQSQLSNNLQQDNDFNGDHEQVSKVASSSILSQITDMAKGGNLDGIKELFSGAETTSDSPVLSQIQPNVVSSLTDKLGLDSGMAQGLVAKILPIVMNLFNNKVQSQQQAGGFDIASIVGSLTGGGNQGGLSQLSNIIGGLVGGNDTANTQQSSGGGIFSIIKKLFGGSR